MSIIVAYTCLEKCLPFDVYVFDAKTLCNENFIIEPKAAKFLIKHGFDFNQLFQIGLPYSLDERDELNVTKYVSQLKPENLSIRLVILQIIRHKLPIVFHNGFCDLVFMYHHFYQDLPEKADVFQQDVNDLFRGGVYDTKYISFDAEDLSCSYLSYIFKKIQRNDAINKANKLKNVVISFPKFDSIEPTINVPCKLGKKFHSLLNGVDISLQPGFAICEKFAQSGYCLIGSECSYSHNVDDILDAEYYYTHQRAQKRIKLDKNSSFGASVEKSSQDEKTQNDTNCSFGHRAGFDSFITGYCFAYFLLAREKPSSSHELCDTREDFLQANFNIEHMRNRLALVKKTHPFCLMKSNFVKKSTEHLKKSEILFGPIK